LARAAQLIVLSFREQQEKNPEYYAASQQIFSDIAPVVPGALVRGRDKNPLKFSDDALV
jgi:hypothetical protein